MSKKPSNIKNTAESQSCMSTPGYLPNFSLYLIINMPKEIKGRDNVQKMVRACVCIHFFFSGDFHCKTIRQ